MTLREMAEQAARRFCVCGHNQCAGECQGELANAIERVANEAVAEEREACIEEIDCGNDDTWQSVIVYSKLPRRDQNILDIAVETFAAGCIKLIRARGTK